VDIKRRRSNTPQLRVQKRMGLVNKHTLVLPPFWLSLDRELIFSYLAKVLSTEAFFLKQGRDCNLGSSRNLVSKEQDDATQVLVL
jgi:hypothetical protein